MSYKGFKNIIKNSLDLSADVYFSSRGLQKLILNANLNKIVQNLKLRSTLIFNTYYNYLNLAQYTSITYPITKKLIARLRLNIDDVDREVSATVKYHCDEISPNLHFAAFANFSEISQLTHFHFATMFTPNEFMKTNLILNHYGLAKGMKNTARATLRKLVVLDLKRRNFNSFSQN